MAKKKEKKEELKEEDQPPTKEELEEVLGEKDNAKKKEKKEVCETFKVKEEGKEKIVESCGEEEVKKGDSKKVLGKENKILKIFLVILGVIIIGLIIGFWYGKELKQIEYQGVSFNILTDKGGLTFYHTYLPSILQGKRVNYNIYLREDPRKIGEKIPFHGSLIVPKIIVLNSTDSFNCEGDGIIAISNLAQVLGFFGVQTTQNSNATCENTAGKYGFINILQGEETKVTQTGELCYEFEVKDCEILKATERYLLEALIQLNAQ
jgi:hypothetical protein